MTWSVRLAPAVFDPHQQNGATNEATLGSVGEGTSGGQFKILRPRAKGALGQIWIARGAELNRDAALKEIQTAQAFDRQAQSRPDAP